MPRWVNQLGETVFGPWSQHSSQGCQKRIFLMNSRSSGQPKNDAKTLFSPPSFPFPWYFLQLQQYWHLYCFTILGSTSTVIHSVKQRLLRNRPGSSLRPLTTFCVKDYKAHLLAQTSFIELPNSPLAPSILSFLC